MNILQGPHEGLSTVCAPFPSFAGPSPYAKLAKYTRKMFGLMYASGGIGLAAPQVGRLERFFIMNTCPFKFRRNEQVFINPEILAVDDTLESGEEGCLSFPGKLVDVERSKSVHVKWMDIGGFPVDRWFQGLDARCILHEIDHLNGITILDAGKV